MVAIEHAVGPAAACFAPGWPADPSAFTVRIVAVDEPCVVVLGRSQAFDGPAVGVPVVRRVSGGGAVWLDSGLVWFDVWVPAGHARWSSDVGRAAWWVGDAVAGALPGVGGLGLQVQRGAMVHHDRDRDVCWLGLGAGEVHDGEGRKVVGISQRRVRAGALFQVGVLLAAKQQRLGPLMSPPVDEAAILRSQLACGLARADVVAAVGGALAAG